MTKKSIERLVTWRQYEEVEKQAEDYIKSGEWEGFLTYIQDTPSTGKARDALVALLQLECVGGTDTDVFKEFADLKGTSLKQVRDNANELATALLKDQIENRHTFFLDTWTMVGSPFFSLIKLVSKARKRELANLEKNPSRLDVLRTFYGFTILTSVGAEPTKGWTDGFGRRHGTKGHYLEGNIVEEVSSALKHLAAEAGIEVDMDKRYETLGSSNLYKDRCMGVTSDILSNAVRLSLYRTPASRVKAARGLGKTEDSRALPVLDQRLRTEMNRKVRESILQAMGNIGHEDSLDTLFEHVRSSDERYSYSESMLSVQYIGSIRSEKSKEILIDLLRTRKNPVKAAAIYGLIEQDKTGLFNLVSPYLKDRSRPLVRASVIAMMSLGQEGEEAVKTNVSTIIKSIGTDRASKKALEMMFSIPTVGEIKSIHQFYARQIVRLEKELRQNTQRARLSWVYRRIERKIVRELKEILLLVEKYLKHPFDDALVKALELLVDGTVLDGRTIFDDRSILDSRTINALAKKILGQSPVIKQRKKRIRKTEAESNPFKQTELDSFDLGDR